AFIELFAREAAAEQAAAWKVRADAVGLLAKVATGGPQRSARPTAFVEDCAVPVESMSEFIAGFRTILDRAGVSYGMFGHADVGCVHVRPALDLTDPEHEQLIRSITDAVVELVADHGGVLWGEHGRGFRGDSVASFLTPETIEVMRLVKRAFDPDDLLNPGKLYRPAGSDRPILAVDEPPLRGQRDRLVPVAIRHRYDSAFACNGNGLCHHHGSTEVMCPSYKATGDPALSPKARTDLLRAWLSRRAEPTGPDEKARADLEAFEDAIAANLHQCLSCSACTGHCPVEVDIPELKSKFLNSYYEHRRRPAAHHLLGRFERVAVTGSKLAGWAPRLTALGARPAGRLLGLVDLPVPKPPSTPGSPPPRFEPGLSQVDLVIMPEVFTTALEPDTLRRAVELLQSMDLSVAVARLVPSGKFDHVKGRRRAFEKSVRAQERLVRSIVDSGAQPVVIEPAVALLHRAEYVHTVAGYPGDAVRHLVEILDRHRDRIARSPAPAAITLLAHCTEQATAPESVAAWKRVLEAAGHTVTVPGVGCCGMAGIFGHEVENQSMSRALWDLTWATRIDAEDAVPVATGYSCRSQAARFADRPVGHPLEHLID
ncbi:MAG: FAD-linked oxidase C-terminal domain-containing protein, partial [Acidimicrobiales bacterium]